MPADLIACLCFDDDCWPPQAPLKTSSSTDASTIASRLSLWPMQRHTATASPCETPFFRAASFPSSLFPHAASHRRPKDKVYHSAHCDTFGVGRSPGNPWLNIENNDTIRCGGITKTAYGDEEAVSLGVGLYEVRAGPGIETAQGDQTWIKQVKTSFKSKIQ